MVLSAFHARAVHSVALERLSLGAAVPLQASNRASAEVHPDYTYYTHVAALLSLRALLDRSILPADFDRGTGFSGPDRVCHLRPVARLQVS